MSVRIEQFVILAREDPRQPGRFEAWCPDVANVFAVGRTRDEAIVRATEVVRALVAERARSGDAVAAPCAATTISVAIPSPPPSSDGGALPDPFWAAPGDDLARGPLFPPEGPQAG